MLFTKAISIATAVALSVSSVAADRARVMQYWGQNSAMGWNTQKNLASYCDGSTDIVILSFVSDFNLGGLPTLNLSGACTDTYAGTSMLNCPQVANDIKTCQSNGVKVLLSLGGGAGSYGFQNDGQAIEFANTLWNLFGRGWSSTRPFQSAVVDGFDLDIEGGGSTGYVAMVKQLRNLFATDNSKSYMITSAPQCPFPDAMLGSVISSIGFDAINVQFYNNYCSPLSGSFNFQTWDNWAKYTSPNKNVKVFLTVPGSPSAAGSGYVPFNQLSNIIKSLPGQYSSYGGVSIWDASQSYGNTEVFPNFAVAVASIVHRTSTGSPTCVNQGDHCSNNGSFVCTNGGFGICDNGSWSVQACSSGTQCLTNTDNTSVYCGIATGDSNICTNPSASSKFAMKVADADIPTPKPYVAGQVSAQVSVLSSTSSTFEFVINARRLNTLPFGSSVVVSFTVANGVAITNVTDGTVNQIGNKVVAQIKNTNKQSMSLVFNFSGSVKDIVFTTPDDNSMSFQT
ncbi:glycoside hydrolase superfamily [Spinellus fusiger]|nr:glycoside hydrolase superfamily [Spinellus fusiger]